MKRQASFVLLAALSSIALAVSVASAGTGAKQASRATVKVAFNKTLKKSIVVDGKGRTLYLFVEDTHGKATCAAADPQCPKVWPAFATAGRPIAGKGIKASLLGTTKGAAGATQVTYNHHPLYYFRDDKPGQAGGQGFASYWYVVSPKGTAIKTQ